MQRVVLYEAREAEALPELGARRAGRRARSTSRTFFSPRAAAAFVRLVTAAGLADTCRSRDARSPSAPPPPSRSRALPFARTVAAERPTRQAVLDEIDRLPPPGVQSPSPMTDTPTPTAAEPSTAAPGRRRHRRAGARRGLGVVGAFVTGLVAAVIVLAGAAVSLPYWPQEARTLWRGPAAAAPPPAAPPPR